jgi:hypothetical protein
MQLNSRTPMRISGAARSFLNFGLRLTIMVTQERFTM